MGLVISYLIDSATFNRSAEAQHYDDLFDKFTKKPITNEPYTADGTSEAEGEELAGITPTEKQLATVVYTMISILCVGGNGMVIFIILFFKQMRKMKMNLLILNLACSDLLLGTFCTFFTYYPMLVAYPDPYPWTAVICKFTGFIQMACVMASSYTLVVISVDRYLAIMYPLNNAIQMTHIGAMVAVVGIWISAAIVCCPILFALQHQDGSCYELWGDSLVGVIANYLFSVGFVILQYFVALAVIIVTYGLICRDLLRDQGGGSARKQNRATGKKKKTKEAKRQKGDSNEWEMTDGNVTTNGDAPNHAELQQLDGQQNTIINYPLSPADERRDAVKRMLPTVITVSAGYAICWLPLNTLSNILLPLNMIDFTQVASTNRFLRTFWLFHTLAMSQSFINPIIYYFRSPRFHRYFHMLIRGQICRRRDRYRNRMAFDGCPTVE